MFELRLASLIIILFAADPGMKKELAYIIGVGISFGLYFIVDELFFTKTYRAIENILKLFPLSYFLTSIIVALPVFLFVYFTNKGGLLGPLGLKKHVARGIGYSFIFALPMFIGYAVGANFRIELTLKGFWLASVLAALFEEILFRGFFFGQLFRNTRLGFIPSLLVSALIFASLHLYQSNDLNIMIGVFITTFLGAGLFAWLFVEWDFNLWIAIGLHFFMNLSWEMFAVSDHAFGNWYANLFRVLTIAFAIIGTIMYKKRKGLALGVHKKNLMIKTS